MSRPLREAIEENLPSILLDLICVDTYQTNKPERLGNASEAQKGTAQEPTSFSGPSYNAGQPSPTPPPRSPTLAKRSRPRRQATGYIPAVGGKAAEEEAFSCICGTCSLSCISFHHPMPSGSYPCIPNNSTTQAHPSYHHDNPEHPERKSLDVSLPPV